MTSKNGYSEEFKHDAVNLSEVSVFKLHPHPNWVIKIHNIGTKFLQN